MSLLLRDAGEPQGVVSLAGPPAAQGRGQLGWGPLLMLDMRSRLWPGTVQSCQFTPMEGLTHQDQRARTPSPLACPALAHLSCWVISSSSLR